MLLQAMASSTVDHHLTPPPSEPTSLASVAPVESLEALSSSLPPETPRRAPSSLPWLGNIQAVLTITEEPQGLLS